jgi:cell division protein ZapD
MHEQTRVLLRLEYLFSDLERHMEVTSYDSIFLFLKTLDEILMVLELNNVKQYLLSEIKEISERLLQWRQMSNVSSIRIDDWLSDFHSAKILMENGTSKPGDKVRTNDFIKAFRQKNNIPGGISPTDFPRFHYWLRQDLQGIKQHLREWFKELEEVGETTTLVLDFMRQSIVRRNEEAESGFFQVSLKKHVEYKLVEVSLPSNSSCFAEISGGRYHITVRMVHESINETIEQYRENVPFVLGTCTI